MSYAVTWYTTANEIPIAASKTDQAGCHSPHNRTYCGYPLAYVGEWFAIQIPYRPFKEAVADAAKKLREKKGGER
jgi:hypothetical protein